MSRFASAIFYKIGGLTLLLFTMAIAQPKASAQAVAAPSSAPAAAPAPPDASPAASVPVASPPEASAPLPATGQDRIEDLDQRTRIVERKLELAQEAAAAAAKQAPILDVGENGFGISSPDRQYQIRFKGLLQIDGSRFFTSDPTLQNSDTFLPRRVRPIVAGTILGLTDFYIAPDFGNNTVLVIDAYLDVHPRPWLRLRVGKFKGPLGLERLQADQDVTFAERALDSNLTAQRELGLQLWGDIAGGIVHYEGGVYNGNPDNGVNDVDSDHAKSFEGRLFVQPFNTDSLRAFGRLGLGIAAGTGNEKGVSTLTAPNTWLGAFKSIGQQTIFSYLASTTDATQTVIAFERHSRVNPQLYYYNGPFGLLAEWVKEHQEVQKGTDTGAFNNSAGHITLSGALGGDVTYEGVKPYKPLDWAAGTFGALELGLRFSWLNVDGAAFPTEADPTKSVSKARDYGVGLNWQLSRNLKASGDYDQTSFTGGAKTGNRPTEKIAIGRFQVSF